MLHAPDCGGKCAESSKPCDPLGSWLRTYLRCALEGLTTSSLRWKNSGTPRGRSWWVLGRSARRTRGTGSGSSHDWGTPHAHERTHSPRRVDHGKQLANQVASQDGPEPDPNWMTPNTVNRTSRKAKTGRPTSGPSRGGPSLGLEEQAEAQQNWGTPRVTTNGGIGYKPYGDARARLEDQVIRDWLTPKASYSNRSPEAHAAAKQRAREKYAAGWYAKGCGVPGMDDLQIQARQDWPTPDANEGNGGRTARTGCSPTGRMPDGSKASVNLHARVRMEGEAESNWPTPMSGAETRTAQGGIQLLRTVREDWATPKSTLSGPDYARMGRPASGGDDLVTQAAREERADWRTPRANDVKQSSWMERRDNLTLTGQALVEKGRPTPRAEDAERTGNHRGVPDELTSAARIRHWPTPTAGDERTTAARDGQTHGPQLRHLRHTLGTRMEARPRTAASLPSFLTTGPPVPESPSTPGSTPDSSKSETKPSPGSLNHRWTCQLMGFPATWCDLSTTELVGTMLESKSGGKRIKSA